MDKIIKYILIVVGYFILINLAFNFLAVPASSSSTNQNTGLSGVFQVSLGVSDSVSASVVRPRWYGTYYENDYSDGKIVTLNVFKIKYFRLPIQANSLNFLWVHAIFAGVLVFFIIRERRSKHEKSIPSVNNTSYQPSFLFTDGSGK